MWLQIRLYMIATRCIKYFCKISYFYKIFEKDIIFLKKIVLDLNFLRKLFTKLYSRYLRIKNNSGNRSQLLCKGRFEFGNRPWVRNQNYWLRVTHVHTFLVLEAESLCLALNFEVPVFKYFVMMVPICHFCRFSGNIISFICFSKKKYFRYGILFNI